MDKIDTYLLEKILICLERIAYCSTPTNLELDAFKEKVLYITPKLEEKVLYIIPKQEKRKDV